MSTKEAKKTEQFEYKAEMKQLLHLIIHSLYTHPEVFLRELISNASDALNKVRYRELTDKKILDAGKELGIHIEADSKTHQFTIRDNGIGMTHEELVNNIGTIARSGTLEFLEQLKASKAKGEGTEGLIGQFGVGFYSVFMVADEVTVETRHADANSKGLRWHSSGEGHFTIEEVEKAERGTTITFKLKDTAKDFAEDYRIKETVKKYSNFADFPVFLGEEKINSVEALWRKSAREVKKEELNEFYKFLTNDYEEPLDHLQLSIEGAAVEFKALVFIPQKAPYDLMRIQEQKSLHLYTNKILIQDDCKELLPEYLRFLKGVVDTSDLPLNVSREVVQSSPVMDKIRGTLTTKVLALLKKWTDKDPEKYLKFYKQFGPLLKTGINSDFSNRDKIIDLLRFNTSKNDQNHFSSLKDYVGRMGSDQKEIYYLSGENWQTLEASPNLEYFKKKEIEVLYLTDPVDVFVFPSIQEYDKKPIKSIEKSDIDLMPEDKVESKDDKLSESLLTAFKDTLGDQVADVVASKRLVGSAVTLVAGKDSLDPQMEKMMKMMNQEAPATKKILEVNMDHALVKNLSRLYMANNKDPMLATCMTQLYESALIIDGNLSSPTDYVKRMTEIMQEATK